MNHPFPAQVLCATWTPSALALGDRDGAVRCYDAETATCLARFDGGRAGGHCVSLASEEEMHGDLVLSGHQDGVLRGWDPRQRDAHPAFEVRAHASKDRGTGAVSCLAVLRDGKVASCGADKRVALSDFRAGRKLFAFDDHADFPYCLAVLDSLLFTGAGDGALLCHDVAKDGSCLWGLGAGLSAVRCVDARPDQLVAAGDDGNVLVWRL